MEDLKSTQKAKKLQYFDRYHDNHEENHKEKLKTLSNF